MQDKILLSMFIPFTRDSGNGFRLGRREIIKNPIVALIKAERGLGPLMGFLVIGHFLDFHLENFTQTELLAYKVFKEKFLFCIYLRIKEE